MNSGGARSRVSAVITALSASGLPMDRFIFHGFLPAKAVRRRQLLASLAEETATLVFFESPNRLMSALQDVADCLGDRPVVICRELTKVFEEIIRGTAADAIRAFSGKTIKGEVTLIVGGGVNRKLLFPMKKSGTGSGCSRTAGLFRGATASIRWTRELGVSRKRVYGVTVKKG